MEQCNSSHILLLTCHCSHAIATRTGTELEARALEELDCTQQRARVSHRKEDRKAAHPA